MSDGHDALAWRDVRVRYPYQSEDAVGPVSLAVRRGERLLLLGPSGAGKSTLLSTLTGLIPGTIPASVVGEVRLMGRDAAARTPAEWAGTTAWLLQDAEHTLCGMTVGDEIAFALENRALPEPEIASAVEAAMTRVEIPRQWLGRRTASLSGGEKQLVALAAAVAQQAPLLVADEPSAHLAPEAADRLRRLILDDPARTILIVDHRLDGLVASVDRVAVLGRDGGLLAVDAPGPLFRRYGTDLAAMGIWRPAAAELDAMLAEAGLMAETPPLTVDDALRAIDPPPASTRKAAIGAVSRFVAGRTLPVPEAEPGEVVAGLFGAACAPLFGPTVLEGITLSVRRGETVAILGRNGAGKSTLAASLAGLLRLKAGRREGQPAGMAFQNPESQLIAGSVLDEVAEALAADVPSAARASREAEHLLDAWGLEGLAQRHPFELSQGQKRRLALLCLAATDRWPLLVLDEPTAGLDAAGVDALARRIAALAAADRAIAIVTHDMDFALKTCRRAIVVGDGTIIADQSMNAVAADRALLEGAGLREPAVMPAMRWLGRHAPC